MKKFRWILALAVAAVMLCAFFGATAEEVPADAIALQLNTEQSVTLEAGEVAWFSFTPAEDGMYTFASNVGMDTYGYLYEIAETGLKLIVENDDFWGDRNFRISRMLEAGKTYYLKARFYSSDTSGDITVTAGPFIDLTASAVGSTSESVSFGTEMEMAVEASSGRGDITYQWAVADAYGLYHAIENATENRLTVTVNEIHTSYLCFVTDGITTKDIYFDAFGVDHVLASVDGDTDLFVNYGDTIELSVTASSDSNILNYQWYKTGPNNYNDYMIPIEGANESSIITESITQSSTKYRCDVSGRGGSTRSVYFTLHAEAPVTMEMNHTINIQTGESVTLEVQAECATPVTYQWYRRGYNGTDIELKGETGASYTTEPVYNSTRYWCLVTNTMGTGYGSNFDINVEGNITAYADDRTAVPGDSVTFSPSVDIDESSLNTLTYQWYERVDHTWDSLRAIEGATESTFTLESAAEAGYYPCKITGTTGCETVVYSRLQIYSNLNAWATESTFYGTGSEPVELHVEAESSDNVLTYQWYKGNGNDYYNGVATLLEGATDASYVVTGQKIYNQEYICEVRDSYKNVAIASTNAYVYSDLTVNTDGDSSVFVEPGGSVTLGVLASSSGEISYQWIKDMGEGRMILEGETGSTLTLNNVQAEARYDCVVSDTLAGGNTALGFTVYVTSDLTAEAVGETTKYIQPGSGTQLEVSAQGSGILTYEWGKIQGDKYGHYAWIPFDGADESSFSLSAAEVDYSGQNVTCLIKDAYGNVATVDFWINIDNQISVTPEGDSTKTLEPGQTAVLKANVEALDTSNITYSWYKQEFIVESESWGDRFKLNETSDTLITDPANCRTEYYCEVVDRYGNSKEVYFYVSVDNALTVKPEGTEDGNYQYYSVEPGASLTLKATVTAHDSSALTYSWQRSVYNAETDEWNSEELPGISGTEYTVENISDRANYFLYVSDQYGNQNYAQFDISIDNQLEVWLEDADQHNSEAWISVKPGNTQILQVYVNAADMTGITYQWSKETLDPVTYVWSATEYLENTTASWTADSPTARTRYTCNVKDRYGNSQSVRFYLTVDNELNIRPVDAEYGSNNIDISVAPGGSITLEAVASAADMTGLTYKWRWQRYNEETGDWETGDLDSTGTSVTVSNVEEYTDYWCTVQDRYANDASAFFHVSIDNSLQAFVGETEAPFTSVTITPGQPAVLKVTVSANDDTGITYQWERRYVQNGVWTSEELPEVTGDTCVLSNQEAQGEYVCTVKDRYGNTREVTFAITVDNAFSAVIAGTENDHWMYDDVEPGEPFAMAVEARGNDLSGVTYRWSYHIYNPETGEYVSGWLEDATGSEYTADAVSAVGAYHCQISDGYGNTVTIDFVIRSVKNNLQPTAFGTDTNRENKMVPVGENVEMRVVVSASNTENLRYQWYNRTYSGGGGPGGLHDEPIEGAQSDTYTIEKIQAAETYYCQVKDCYGNLNSVFFTLNIDNEFTAASAGDTDISVYYGEPARLEVSASCRNGELTYEWYNVNNGTLIDGANGSVFEIPAVTDRYTYRCHVADQYGNYNDIRFYVSVRTDLRAQIKGAAEIAVRPGERATLEVEASCNYGDIQYQWAIDDGSGPGGHAISGATAASYTTDPVYEATNYMCWVNDMFGSGMFVRCRVTIDNELSVEPVGETKLRVPVSGQANLAVSADCLEGELTYQWASQPWIMYLDAWENIPGANAAECTTPVLTENTEFRCQVTDQYGNTVSVYFYVYCSDTDKLNPPTIQILDSGTLGQDVLAQIGYPAGAIYVWAEFGYINENGDFNSLISNDVYYFDPSFSVPGYLLLEDLDYQIRAQAWAREPWEQPLEIMQDSDWAVIDLELAQAEIPDGPEVTISGGTEYDYSVEDTIISYTIPGAQMTAYRLTLTNPVSGETIFWNSVSGMFSGETAEITLELGENQFEFWAKYNGVWSRLSEPYTVVLNPVGYLDIPTVKVDGNVVSDSLIVKTNAIPTLEVSCGNAEVIDCVIRRDGDWVDSASINGESGECDLSSALQTPGEYMLDLYAWNRGWLTRGHKYISVTVRAPELTNILTLPSGLLTIESEAFAGLTNVDAVRIPASVETIADDAFSGSNIVIIAPAGSENIISWAEAHGFECVTE